MRKTERITMVNTIGQKLKKRDTLFKNCVMHSIFRRATNKDLIRRIWDREMRVMQTVLTDNNKKSQEQE